jgi:hypothetical protein
LLICFFIIIPGQVIYHLWYIVKQLEEGKKEGTKVRDFEELAKELGI